VAVVADEKRLKHIPLARRMVRVVIPSGVYARMQGWWWSRSKPDRRYLEQAILPAMVGLAPSQVLFVGTQGYTSHYGKWFEPHGARIAGRVGCQYWTMDIQPSAARFGSPDRHVTGNVTDVDQHFAPGFFDVVLLNGIFGFGLDDPRMQARTLQNIRKVLRPGGILLLGWSRGFSSDPLESPGIPQGLAHADVAGLGARKEFPDSIQVYDFFQAH
jgi:SAM-dependent methyltransferase